MIRILGNRFIPGSVVPPEAQILIDVHDSWSPVGRNVLILGPPRSGKTVLGSNILRKAAEADESLWVNYWTERDFLADQRNLWRQEDLAAKVTRDDGLWSEYLEWERTYHDYRETTLLMLDDVGVGYSPHHRYELDGLLRQRRNLGLSTVVVAETELWSNLPKGLRMLVEDGAQVVSPQRPKEA